MKKIFSQAFKKAAEQTAKDMSAQVKRNAVRDGWPMNVAATVDVKFNSGNFEMTHAPEHNTAVFDLEYGTENNKGKHTLHKMYNSTDETKNRFAVHYVEDLFK